MKRSKKIWFGLLLVFSIMFGSFLNVSSDVSASTVICTLDLSSYIYNFSNCISTLDSTKDYYYTFNFKRGTSTGDLVYFTDASAAVQRFSQTIDFGRYSSLGPSYSDTLLNTVVFTDSYSSTGHHFNRIAAYSGSLSSALSDVSLTVSDDSLGSCSSPTGSLSITENGSFDVVNFAEVVVNVPPEIIQGDYHDDLLSINNSILIVAAVGLVIYFFYAIYKMILGGRR